MATDIQTIAQLLDTSLIPSQNKQAESTLRSIEREPGFALNLLRLVASDGLQVNTRLAGALYFKNFIGRNWTDEEGRYKLAESDVAAIKQEIVGLMISVRPNLQVQLGEAISIIAESDFFQRWDTLIDDLVSRLTPDNTKVNNGVLQVAHAIFKRWRPLFRSDELFTEINHVLSKFPTPFLQLFQSTDALIEQNQNNKEALLELFATLNLIIKISYDLNCQDLAPAFEDNLPAVMGIFHKYLTYSNPVLETDDDDEAGPLERVKSGICELLQLFAFKYNDVFDDLLQDFANSTWGLLTNLGPAAKYDILVSRALQFLTAVARSPKHAQNFSSEDVLSQVVEKIMLPNMTLRESDEELFEDDPIEFIRRDLEGSDSETRRRAATDFLRQLLDNFDKAVTQVVMKYVNHYLAEGARDPKENWRSKDTALYLFSSIAVKGITERTGASRTNPLVDVLDFFKTNIAADLTADFGAIHPILKVDSIKYLNTFRSQLNKDQLKDAFPLLAKHLVHPNYVVYTYTAVTIDRLLAMSVEHQPVFAAEDVQPFSRDILQHLFKLIEQGGTPEKIAENEFLMRCVMRILVVQKEAAGPLAEFSLGELLKIVGETSKNPSNPRFNHYTFEAVGAVIRFAGAAQPEALENALHDPLMSILGNDVTEFIPYVFQLLSLLLEINPKAPLPKRYQDLVTPLLTPALWESRGNVPALVRLLGSIMGRGASIFVEQNKLTAVLGIFQKLISSKLTESNAFDLLEFIFTNFPITSLQPYIKDIFIILFTRLKGSKTATFSQRFERLIYWLSGSTDKGAGPDFIVAGIDSVQPGLFDQVYSAIILPDTKVLSRPADRKVAVVGLVKFITQSSSLKAGQPYHKLWTPTVITLLKFLEAGEVVVKDDPTLDLRDAEIDDVSFGASFARLNTCKKAEEDPFPEAQGDLRIYTGRKIKEALADGQRGLQAEVEGLSAEVKEVLQKYLAL